MTNNSQLTMVLAMKPEESKYFSAALLRHNIRLNFAFVERIAQFEAIRHRMNHFTRILCFSTFVIVPKHIIDLVEGNCYNLHPASAKYPGFDPIGMALYHQDNEFGAVLHQIAPKVDSGAIVSERKFSFNANATRTDIAIEAYKLGARLVTEYSELLADNLTPLPINDKLQWNENYRSSRQLVRDMNKVDYELPIEEQLRRYKAFGDCNPEAGLKEIYS